jgi:signal transduction histidine kinase
VCIAPAGTTSHFVRAQVLPLTEDSEIVWTPRGTLAQSVRDHAVWSGQIDTPLAGTWSLLLPYGDAWWRSALFTRWFPVAAALLLLLLAVPVLLLISIRRRARLDEARARFLNEIAHDLRTPLTSLRLYADMLAGDDVERTARTRYAGVIARESARLTALLANLLDLSRLEGGKRLYDVQDVAVSSAVSGAVADFGALYPGRAGDVTCEGGDDVVARADPTGLARCLGNLLDNAGKFTEPGTPIRVKWSREGGEVRVAVADDGPGVPEDERRSIFERYSRGDRAQQDGIQGTGLGLSLVRELVQGMGGSIELVDAPGAAFVLRLSAAPTEDGRAPERAPATTGGERA